MKEPHILMKNFQLQTYESQGNFPEIEVHASFIFPTCGKSISNIDMMTIKQELLQTMYYQAVNLQALSSQVK